MSLKPSIEPRRGLFTLLVAVGWLLGGLTQTLSAGECDTPVAQAVSLQGRVEMAAGDPPAWSPVEQHQWLCPGDRLRVGPNSRAGLVLNDDTLLRLAENSSIRISAPAQEGSAWLDLLEGVAHFISRVRHSFRVDTPYVNASIEGTEFTVSTWQDGAGVSVLEGRVRAANPQGEVLLNGGERALAKPGQAPRIEAVVDPLDAVQWALYYPPLTIPAFDNPPAALRQSLDAYRQGDSRHAFATLQQVDGVERQAALLVYRATLHLQVGGVAAAQRDLDSALKLEPDQPDTLALMSIIASVRNERQQALELARRAVAADAPSAAPLLALSYARQALFQLPEALEAAESATRRAPDSALAWARVADLQLMFRRMNAATEAAAKAVSIAPGLAQTQTTLGFAQLVRLKLDDAQEAFQQAASLDQAAPLPRLGLGLVLIRKGELSQGRRQLETAANLDPGNALIRSYLGKAYYEEKRDQRAATQFALAKEFDDLDPTAWFYDAILKQTQNRPLEALSDIESAITRNDNRAVYRSRLLLDEDRAARSASLANIYDDLGFERLALKESWKSLATDPGNASAHRFLSDAYAGAPRHEIARVSELLQYQMLNPEIAAPVSPSASETNLLAFQGSGPAQAGYNEYNPLFNRQRLALIASGVSGSNNTRGEEITLGGFTNRGMLSAGYYNESSDGFRENNASEQTIRNLFGQLRLTSQLSVQAEVKDKEETFGDMVQRFDSSVVFDDLLRTIDSDSRRLGFNFSPGMNDTFLVSAIHHELDDSTSVFGNTVDTHNDGDQYEIQYIHHGEMINLEAGLGRLTQDSTTILTLPFFGQLPPTEEELEQNTAHLYTSLIQPWGQVTVGVDYMDLDDGGLISDQAYNPKFGLLWNLSDSTLIRVAAFKTLRGELLDNMTLMPTQVAGFNQIFDDFFGTQAKLYGFGIDQRFTPEISGGLELSRRDLTKVSDNLMLADEDQDELSHRAYLYWNITKNFNFRSEYQYEKFERDYTDGFSEPDRPAALDTRIFTLGSGYFHPSGLFADLSVSHVSQEIEQVLVTTGTASDDDSFTIADAELGYRLPARHGLLRLQVKNLFDKTFNYQSTFPGTGTPKTSPLTPERTIFMKAQFLF